MTDTKEQLRKQFNVTKMIASSLITMTRRLCICKNNYSQLSELSRELMTVVNVGNYSGSNKAEMIDILKLGQKVKTADHVKAVNLMLTNLYKEI